MGWFRRKKQEPIVEDVWSMGPISAPVSAPTPAYQPPESSPPGVTL